MKRRITTDVFGLSFLDVISCSFAAMLALLILAKNSDVEIEASQEIVEIDNSLPIDPLLVENSEIRALLSASRAEFADLIQRSRLEAQKLAMAEDVLNESLQASRVVREVETSAGSMESIYAGGIPVGAENVIFVIDTSGSMKAYWEIVMRTLDEILASHPEFKGLQVLSDNGEYLIPGYAGMMIPDTQAARNRASEKLKSWNALSNSSPAEGLEIALKAFAKTKESLSIYVFGDDFTGNSFDEVLSVVDRWNVSEDGQRLASIHGVGFPWGIGNRYATLMREVAYRNKGVFVGL
jgi:hypothetical protein